MGYFRYEVADKKGRVVNGTMQAVTQREVVARLREQGYTVRAVAEHGQPSPAPPSEMPAASTSPQRVGGKVTERDLYFFFTQVASMLRAGMAPVEVMRGMSVRAAKPVLREAAGEMERAAAQGVLMSHVMEHYRCFPEHAVGAIRAGELSGFLPEAAHELAEQFNSSVRYRRFFWVARLGSWNGALLLVLGIPIMPALWSAFHAAAGTTGGATSNLMGSYMDNLLHRSLPIAALVFLVYYLLKMALSSRQGTRFRHRALLSMWYGIGRRARAESLRAFLFSLRQLYAAALPPATAWNGAAAAVPNMIIRERLQRVGQEMESGANVDTALERSGLFPTEYVSLVGTGRLAGDMVGMLDQAYRLSSDEFAAAELKSKIGTVIMGITTFVVGVAAFWLLLVYNYYGRMFDEVDKFMK